MFYIFHKKEILIVSLYNDTDYFERYYVKTQVTKLKKLFPENDPNCSVLILFLSENRNTIEATFLKIK